MRKIIYQGKYLTMSTEDIDGHIYERVTLRPGVKILAVQDDKILFIKEYRAHEKSARWKLVTGWVDKENKTTLQIAKEELQEEASYQAKNWELFYHLQTTGGTVEVDTSYFIAKDLQQLPPQNNPDNDIVQEKKFLTKQEIIQKMQQKEIIWEDDMAVVWMYFENFKRNQ